MKKIMLITANYTGHGHKSISDSITEQLKIHDDVEILTVDGFSLIGDAGVKASKLYGPMTRKATRLWELSFSLSDKQPAGMEDVMTALIHKRLIKILRDFNPDAIVTVHSMFNASVLNVLRLYRIEDIPFIVCQADLINIHSSWCDPRATTSICLTEEAVESSVKHGMPRASLEKIGFPSRKRFCDAARNATERTYTGKPLRCLMMSGGDGGSDMLMYAENILTGTDCSMEFICGRDARTKQKLENEIASKYPDRVKVFGFVDDVEKHMQCADLLIARGSPNTLMEAVVMNLPIMIIGCLPGQEADNPDFMVAHNLAVTCDTPTAAPMLIHALSKDNGKRLSEICAAQREYRNLDNAKNIAERIYALTVPLARPFPPRKLIQEIGARIMK